MSILRVTCSPRGAGSESHRLSQAIIGEIARADAAAAESIVEVDASQLPHVDPDYAAALCAAADPAGPVAERGSMGLSARLIASLAQADYVVIATPMHNFTVPSALKAWIDHVVRVRHTFRITPEGKIGTLADRPVFVAVASGGRYSGGGPRQPDFLTPYLKTVLGTIGLHDLMFFAVEGTAQGLDGLRAARAAAEAQVAAAVARTVARRATVLAP